MKGKSMSATRSSKLLDQPTATELIEDVIAQIQSEMKEIQACLTAIQAQLERLA